MFTTVTQVTPLPVSHGDNAYLEIHSLPSAVCGMTSVGNGRTRHTSGYPNSITLGTDGWSGPVEWGGTRVVNGRTYNAWPAGTYTITASCKAPDGRSATSPAISVKLP